MNHGPGQPRTDELRQLLAAATTPQELVALASERWGHYCAAVRDEGRTVDEVAVELGISLSLATALLSPEPAQAVRSLLTSHMVEIGSRARKLPAPPHVVWESLVEPRRPTARAWLNLNDDEVEPRVLSAERPDRVTWSTLWPSRPNDEVHFELDPAGGETRLRFTLLTPDAAPGASQAGHLRRRLNELLFADLRFSYGQ